ncbi:MAG: purine-nucleoside phosphorylase [Chloroflexi bacterium]|nr:purine-nucleoside phosphorylase [Chloroflexota bacterium]
MKRQFSRTHYQESATFISRHTSYHPKVAFVLGSGLSTFADAITAADIIPYHDIPYFPVSTVEGHKGRLVVGLLEGREVMVMQGRVHYYEGFTLEEVTFPVRAMHAFGIETLVLTNAAGGLNPSFQPGDLMLIEDQINLVGMIGHNPLMGPNDAEIGPRFPDMSTLYDRQLRELALATAAKLEIPLQRGVYVGLSGPAYETPAEVRFLRMIGADATGMSTTNEALVAHHAGMRVLGFSGISNLAIDQVDSERQTTHEEVIAAGRLMAPRLVTLLTAMLARWDEIA